MWSAAIDPTVLAVSATADRALRFDVAAYPHLLVVGADGREHFRITTRTGSLRLDVVAGTLMRGPIGLCVHLACDATISAKLVAVDRLLRLLGQADGGRRREPVDRRLPRLVEALRVVDALASGASNAEIAADLEPQRNGPLDWPGEGDYLRSRTRRRIALARRMMAAGPAGILGFRV